MGNKPNRLMCAKWQNFFANIRAAAKLSSEELIRIAKAKGEYHPRVREAALREVMWRAPLEVSQGKPFGLRRRLVRQHYGI